MGFGFFQLKSMKTMWLLHSILSGFTFMAWRKLTRDNKARIESAEHLQQMKTRGNLVRILMVWIKKTKNKAFRMQVSCTSSYTAERQHW